MDLGILARTFSRPTLEQTLDAVRDSGLHTMQFNMALAGGLSLPAAIPAELASRITLRREPVGVDEARPVVVGDLPFGSYQVSDEQAVETAIRFVKEGGADVVKLEGAARKRRAA